DVLFDLGGGDGGIEHHRVFVAAVAGVVEPGHHPAAVGVRPGHSPRAGHVHLASLGGKLLRRQRPPHEGDGGLAVGVDPQPHVGAAHRGELVGFVGGVPGFFRGHGGREKAELIGSGWAGGRRRGGAGGGSRQGARGGRQRRRGGVGGRTTRARRQNHTG